MIGESAPSRYTWSTPFRKRPPATPPVAGSLSPAHNLAPGVTHMSQSPLDPKQLAFRNAMAHMSAAVNIITTDGEAGRCGITATAVCSVTDTPPTLMVCVNRNSAMNAVFKANGRLCANVLSGEQEEAAKHFAGMTGVAMEERFALDPWTTGSEGLPVLEGALANLQGR